MKKVKVKIKDGIKAIVFDPENPPKYVAKITETSDDASGIFEFIEWKVGGTRVKKGDLILYQEYELNRMEVIVIPFHSIGILVEIEK